MCQCVWINGGAVGRAFVVCRLCGGTGLREIYTQDGRNDKRAYLLKIAYKVCVFYFISLSITFGTFGRLKLTCRSSYITLTTIIKLTSWITFCKIVYFYKLLYLNPIPSFFVSFSQSSHPRTPTHPSSYQKQNPENPIQSKYSQNPPQLRQQNKIPF